MKIKRIKVRYILGGTLLLITGILIGISILFLYQRGYIPLSEILNKFTKKTDSKITEKKDYLSLPPKEDIAYLNDILSTIFINGYDQFSTEEKCIKVLKFVSSHHKLKSNSGSATKIIKDGYAICGGLAYVFKILCRLLKIPTRYIGLFGLKDMGSHAICEVYYNNEWHFYDPTYGIFFYSDSTYTGEGKNLSLLELIANPHQATMMKVVSQPWQGYYGDNEKEFRVSPAEGNYISENFINEYLAYFYQTFPVAFDEDASISFPVYADLTDKDIFQIGEIDQSYMDMSSATTKNKYNGIHYLGRENPQAYHTIIINVPERMIVNIQYNIVDEISVFPELLPLKDMHILNIEKKGHIINFKVLIIDELGIGILSCSCGILIDSIIISRGDI